MLPDDAELQPEPLQPYLRRHDQRYKEEYRFGKVDEAQDLTPLQWDMVVKMSEGVERVYIAGDDDQAIYEWNGADVTLFQTFPGKSLVLKKSVRLNKNIHFFLNVY